MTAGEKRTACIHIEMFENLGVENNDAQKQEPALPDDLKLARELVKIAKILLADDESKLIDIE